MVISRNVKEASIWLENSRRLYGVIWLAEFPAAESIAVRVLTWRHASSFDLASSYTTPYMCSEETEKEVINDST